MSGRATLEPAPAVPPPPRAGYLTSRRIRLLGAITGVVVAGLITSLVLWLTRDKPPDRAELKVPASWARPVVSAAGLADRSGVKITQVAVTGDGGLVDLRFQVIDPDKANALHDAATPPAVVDERTGLVVHDLLMSHSHTGAFKPGVTYYYVFNNPGNIVSRGARVVVMLGNAQVEHVKVR
jgi:hypothetical protein